MQRRPTLDFLLQLLLAVVPVVVFICLVLLLVWLLERSRFSERIKDAIARWGLRLIVLAVAGLVSFLFWVIIPDFRSPEQTPRPTRIENAQQLAGLVFSQYDTFQPICVIPVSNQTQTYLLLFSGTELKAPTQASHVTSDLTAALAISFFDFFKTSAEQALQDFRTSEGNHLNGSSFIIVGHSLGGMEAENLVADPAFASRYHIVRLITFGKPKTRAHVPDSRIARHFLLIGDPVVKWVDSLICFVRGHSPGTLILPPTSNTSRSEHSNYPVSEALTRYDALGDLIGAGHSGAVLILDLNHSACFSASNPKIVCTPQTHTFDCNPY